MRVRGRDGAEEGDGADGGPALAQDTDVVGRGGAAGILHRLLVGRESLSLKFRDCFPGDNFLG